MTRDYILETQTFWGNSAIWRQLSFDFRGFSRRVHQTFTRLRRSELRLLYLRQRVLSSAFPKVTHKTHITFKDGSMPGNIRKQLYIRRSDYDALKCGDLPVSLHMHTSHMYIYICIYMCVRIHLFYAYMIGYFVSCPSLSLSFSFPPKN